MKRSNTTLDSQLGKNLKSERERLGMTTGETAYHCQTSAVTIWNWETGKAKIPLNAIARLIPLGFNLGNIIPESETEKVDLRLVGDSQDSRISIKKHVLASCTGLQDWRHLLVYHNLDWISALHSLTPGSLCLVDLNCRERFEGERKDLWTGTFLLHSPASKQLSLAEFAPLSKSVMRIRAGDVAEKASLSEIHNAFPKVIQGKVLGSVGRIAPQDLSSNRHGSALAGAAKAIRGRK